MQFGCRVELENLDSFDRLDKYSAVPIELALPYQKDRFLKERHKIPELISYIDKNNIRINSIHATQGKLTDDDFLVWGADALKLSKEYSGVTVVIHPGRFYEKKSEISRNKAQKIALENIRKLCEIYVPRLAMETFGGDRYLFSPDEIMEYKLPMVLDIAHQDENKSLEIIQLYHQNIKVIHLSAIKGHKHHLPINDFCLMALDQMNDYGFSGTVTLEYLPEYHHRLVEDCLKLIKRYEI